MRWCRTISKCCVITLSRNQNFEINYLVPKESSRTKLENYDQGQGLILQIY